MIPNSKWPIYPKSLISDISKIISSGKVNYWTGQEGKLFEKEFSKKFKINFSCAVSNGSIGLELALLALDIKKDDEILVPSRSYFSSASCIIRTGAKPIFVDLDIHTLNISAEDIVKKITKKTKAIICVHLYGMPCDMPKIVKIAKKHNIKIIEDCSQAHGAKINSKFVGSFGDIGVWSFCNDKIISTGGEGGMVATNSDKLFKKIWSLKDIGKNYSKLNKKNNGNDFPFIHDFIGTNARMTEFQSSIGRFQLKELNNFIKLRNRNANKISSALKNFDSIIIPFSKYSIQHAYYRYVIILNQDFIKNKYNRDSIIQLLNKENISCNVGGCPVIFKEKIFIDYGFLPHTQMPVTKYLEKNTISFLIDQTITKKDINLLIKKLSKVLTIISKHNSQKVSNKLLLNNTQKNKNHILKRFFDIFLSFFLIIILSPVVLFTSVLIFILDQHNPFFLQVRTGLNLKSFKIYKLKTMKLNQKTNKMEVTKIGNIIRLFKIDELLQLINVLKNEMSIVGPRPLFPEFNYFYKEKHFTRVLEKPGITGLAQIKIRDSTNWERKFNFDAIYVKKISFKLDIIIILKTFLVVIKSVINPNTRATESTEYKNNFFNNYS